jgi:hypothetical protein
MLKLTADAATAAAEVKPLRFNFAQICLRCLIRWCESSVSIDKQNTSTWILCPECDLFDNIPLDLFLL